MLPDLQPGHPHPKPSIDAVLPGQAQASQCLSAGGLALELLASAAYTGDSDCGGPPLLQPSAFSLLVDSSSLIHLLPNEGPILAGD